MVSDATGDGRPDLVYAKEGFLEGDPSNNEINGVFQNTGHGWAFQNGKSLPYDLIDADGQPTGARFADVDGDGLPDFVVDSADLVCGSPDTCFQCQRNHKGSACQSPTTHASPAVWLNRFNVTGKWEYHPEFANHPSSWGDTHFKDSSKPGDLAQDFYALADMDGDGRVDLIHISGADPFNFSVDALLNMGAGSGWRKLHTVSWRS